MLDQLPLRVFAGAVPVHHRPRGEGVPKIMDARTAPMPVEPLRRTQSDTLADGREVISGATIVGASSIVRGEERLRCVAQKPVALLGIGDAHLCSGT